MHGGWRTAARGRGAGSDSLMLPWMMLLSSAVRCAFAAVPKDRVTSLPGWPHPLASPIYSGYFTIPPTAPHTVPRHLHYVFIYSERAPATDPVMLWLNGGPGSSSLKGVFSQLGPYSLNDASYGSTDGKDGLRLARNNATWNQFANILYLEQPAGVGFSFCNLSLHQKGVDNCDHSDGSVAADNFALLLKFFDSGAFSEFRSNELYLCGVSYAGVYVTTLAGMIVGDPERRLNLTGITLGNPSFRWGTKEGGNLALAPQSVQGITELRVDMLGAHGQFSPTLYQQIKQSCTFFNNETVRPELKCNALLSEMQAQVGGYDLYNIYDRCKLAGDDVSVDNRGTVHTSSLEQLLHSGLNSGEVPDDSRFGSCGQEHALADYCNEPAVRAALNVPAQEQIGQYYVSGGFNSYAKDEHDTHQYYLQMLTAGVRVLIYSGDIDNCLPYTGSLQWVQLLGLNETAGWRPWTVDGGRRMGGCKYPASPPLFLSYAAQISHRNPFYCHPQCNSHCAGFCCRRCDVRRRAA